MIFSYNPTTDELDVIGDVTGNAGPFLDIDGGNANQNIDINGYDLTAGTLYATDAGTSEFEAIKVGDSTAYWETSILDLTGVSAGYIPVLTPTGNVVGDLGVFDASTIIQSGAVGVDSTVYMLAPPSIGSSACSLEYRYSEDVLWIDTSVQIFDTDDATRALNLDLGQSSITTNPPFKIFGYITDSTTAKYCQLVINDSTDFLELIREDTNILGMSIGMPTTIFPSATQSIVFSTDTSVGTTLTHPSISVTDSAQADVLLIANPLLIEGEGTEWIDILTGVPAVFGCVYSFSSDLDYTGNDGFHVSVGCVGGITRKGTINDYGTGNFDLVYGISTSSTNTATYSGSESIVVLEAGIYTANDSALTFNSNGKEMLRVLYGIAVSPSSSDEEVAGTLSEFISGIVVEANGEEVVATGQVLVTGITINALLGPVGSTILAINDTSGEDWLLGSTDQYIRFGDEDVKIGSAEDGHLDLYADTSIDFNTTANTDITVNFTGTTNSGVLNWMEDEDYFKFQDDIHFGDGTNYANINDTNGQITWGGTYLKKLTLRPNLVEKSSKAGGTPTQVIRGLNIGYSLPIWSNPVNIDEELYFRMRIPIRWDGTTDPQVGIMCTIQSAEDEGDKFKFELSWQTTSCGGDTVMGTTDSDCYSEQTIISGGGTQYTAYCVFFTLDASDATNPIEVGEMLQCRLRRVAASANEVSGEIAVWDWVTMWATDKVYGIWSTESNVT